MLEEEVAARKQLPAGPPQHMGPAGGKDAALSEKRRRRSRTACPSCVGVRGAIAAARVEHLDAHADRAARARARGARRHDKAAEHHMQQVGGKMVAPPHVQRVASLQMRRRVVQLPHGGEAQLVAHKRLCHVDVRRQAPMLECWSRWKLCSMMAFTCTSFSDHLGTSIASAGRTPNGGASSGNAAAARLAGAGQPPARALCNGRATQPSGLASTFW